MTWKSDHSSRHLLFFHRSRVGVSVCVSFFFFFARRVLLFEALQGTCCSLRYALCARRHIHTYTHTHNNNNNNKKKKQKRGTELSGCPYSLLTLFSLSHHFFAFLLGFYETSVFFFFAPVPYLASKSHRVRGGRGVSLSNCKYLFLFFF